MLELRNITKTYSTGGAVEHVLADVSLEVERGKSLAIVGPSGSGKTTLLNIVGALDTADSGQVIIDGQDISLLDNKGLGRLRNSQIGFVFQLHHLLPQCSVLENVLIPTIVAGSNRDKNKLEKRAKVLLDRLSLGEHLGHRPGQLSGGQRQRAAVARALINEPKILLADEPTGSVDSETADGIGDLLTEINREYGVTLVVVTHSKRLAERMGQVLYLDHGKLREVQG